MKPGYKTTEFWLTVAAQALGAGAIVLGQMPQNEKAQTALSIVGAAINVLSLMGYQASRAYGKGATGPLDPPEAVVK